MLLRTFVVGLGLSILPAVSFAQNCDYEGDQALSCAPGLVWSSAAGTCVKQATG